jgi:alcohol dehydrogenase
MMRNCISVHGQWMYPRDAAARMIGLVRAGLARLEEFSITTFPLEKVNDAVEHAARSAGAFRMTIVTP